MGYEFSIEYKQGGENKVDDALPRHEEDGGLVALS